MFLIYFFILLLLFENFSMGFDLGKNDVLVIGYDVAHPPPVTSQERRMLVAKGMTVDSLDPSVVGICANMAKNPFAFVGDYFFQESRKESVDVIQLSERTSWILQTLAMNRPEAARPKYIFVLRDGLSEGQFLMVTLTKMFLLCNF